MRSTRVRIPGSVGQQIPLRLRLWFVLLTVAWAVLLALLGFTNLHHAVPVNDKMLHFACFGFITAFFYISLDIDEEARRVWFWRYAPLAITSVVCILGGSIISEYVQSLLPYKEFQRGDIIANLLGSTLGLILAYHLERHYRRRREIARLYQPLADEGIELPPSDTEDDDRPELPLFRQPHAASSGQHPRRKGSVDTIDSLRVANVWDEREELFGIGDDDDDLLEHPHTARR